MNLYNGSPCIYHLYLNSLLWLDRIEGFHGNIWWADIKIVVLHLLALLSTKDEMVGLIPLKMALKFKNALLPPEGRKLLYNLLSSTGYWAEILKN